MDVSTDVYCATCFAMPGEKCRTKYLIYDHDQVMPVICPTHGSRLAAREKHLVRQSLAQMISAVALACLEQQRGTKA